MFGVQKYFKNTYPILYQSVKNQIIFYQFSIFISFKESNILEEKEEVYKIIIQFLCYANIKQEEQT